MVVGPGGQEAEVRVVAAVLAAGLATRMGVQKVLLPLGGRPMVVRVVDAALRSKAVRTCVVVGHEAERVRQALNGRPLTVVTNPDFADGMSSSLRAAVRAIGGDCDAALFLLADQPFVTPSLLDRLIDGFAVTRAPVVRPVVDGSPANPVLMSAALFPEILAQRGDVGGREIVARHQDEVCLVPVEEPGALADIDSRKDYEAAEGGL